MFRYLIKNENEATRWRNDLQVGDLQRVLVSHYDFFFVNLVFISH